MERSNVKVRKIDVSIVIPTFNEQENVEQITKRIRRVFQKEDYFYEILFVDDSEDSTVPILRELSRDYEEVEYIHRTDEKGLGSAVVTGFHQSRGHFIIVMDSDLQHPPELIPVMLKHLMNGYDVVIPSRFIDGGSDGGLNVIRKFYSWAARAVGQLVLRRLKDISDITSGYFGLQRNVIHTATLAPIGWKILMEVLVKGNVQTVREIPYSFVGRDAGESKLSLKEKVNYFIHIVNLLWHSQEDRRFYLFCLVGGLGVGVNMLFLMVFLHFSFVDKLGASILSTIIAMGHNYLWNDKVTWKERNTPFVWKRFIQFPQYILISTLGLVITVTTAQLFLWLNLSIFLGQLIGIIMAALFSFSAHNRWTWPKSKGQPYSKKVNVTRDWS